MKEFWLPLIAILLSTIFANWFFSVYETAAALADLALTVIE